MSTISQLIEKNRSYRRFDQSQSISEAQLKNWVNLARLSPSGMNLQPLKYKLVFDKDVCASIFPYFAWAGYLKDWDGPQPGEQPTAYIIILGDTDLRSEFGIDPGIAAQSILLGAVEAGYGGCILGSVDRTRLAESLSIPDRYRILFVIALGKPAETVILDEMDKDGNIQYYRDAEDQHHVPKRKLKDILIK